MGSIFECLPIRSVTELRNEIKRKGRKEKEKKIDMSIGAGLGLRSGANRNLKRERCPEVL